MPAPVLNALPYLPLPPIPSSSNHAPNAKCFFCGGPHVMRTCSTAGDYLCAGRIIRDRPYFAYPDHSCIWRYGDKTFQQVIDARYTSAQPSMPATGANSISLDNPRREPTSQPVSSDIPGSAFITESFFLQCEPVTLNHTVIVMVEDEEDQREVETLAVTRSKSKVTSNQE
ncbi:hypothetical protein BDR06DRAFT_311334 [Suillus hirtellus]|nr:hypothetical protein BDR06DRAFT_311334 [Suillus hirtellus]